MPERDPEDDRVRHVIVDAKLAPGVASPQPLARPRLDPPAEFLGGTAAVALLCAPAGYGKTTVMAAWREALSAAGVASVWLSLDPDDDDPARFLRHLVAALSGVRASIGRDVLAQLAGVQSIGVKPLLESLAADLGGLRRRAVLFLDDVHFLTSDDALEIVHWMLNYAPPGLQFVLGSRGEPRLRLGGLRVRRKLVELRTAELALTAEEAQRLLEARLGRAPEPAAMHKLMRKTEGWPAAFELVAGALRSSTDADDLIARFAGTDRSVVDYLGEIVLGGLEPELRGLVECMAQFDRFSVALATRLTGADDTPRQFEALRARHLFLIPLDRHGEEFRFHHLVSDYLRHRLWRESPQRCRQTLSTGARWLHQHGDVEAALHAAIRAQDFDFATQILSECVEDLVHGRGYHQALAQWMREIPEAHLDRHPGIRVNYAFSLAFHARRSEVEVQLERLRRVASDVEAGPRADPALGDAIRRAVAMQEVILHALHDEGQASLEQARDWLRRWPQAPAVQAGHVCNVLAFGLKSAGDVDAGLRAVADARRLNEQAQGHYGLAWSVFIEAMLLMKRGAYREARQVCETGMALIEQRLGGHRAHASLLQTVLATTAYEFDEPAQAASHLEQAMHSVQDQGPADAVILACLTQARLRFLAGDPASAYAILAEGQNLAAQRGLERVVITLAAEECTWLGRQGRHDEAHEAALRSGLLRLTGLGDGSGLLADKSARVALRLKLQHQPQQVVDALAPAIEHCGRLGLQHRLAELRGMRAIALRRAGQSAQALEELDRSLQVAAPRQYIRSYLDEGEEIAALLRQMAQMPERYAVTMPFARRLLRSFDRAAPSRRPTLDEGVYGELTEREIDLLKRLESGMTNREIAESVFITEGTLKWHLTNIYSKLGVKNRSGALVKARGLGLI